MTKAKKYNISPARGQALLKFSGRLFPNQLTLFEAETVEKIQANQQQQLTKNQKTFLNPDFNNLLLQGDCLSACVYLKSKNIKVDLVYIDPPFASGANYAKKIYLRNGDQSELETDGSIGEEVMYGDIWQKEDYLNWLYERLLAIREIMSDEASIYVHLDWHIGHYVKILLDEVFGEDNFINEIIWCYDTPANVSKYYPRKTDAIFLYKKLEKYIFNEDTIRIPYKRGSKLDGKGWGKNTKYSKREVEKGKILPNWWSDITPVQRIIKEITNYSTQKPEKLIERIIKASSDEGMIIADFFSGSGTTAKVANDLNRKFIACDVCLNAQQTTRDRLIAAGVNFDILKIKDGLRLFRNPQQTVAKIFSIIDEFKSNSDLKLSNFWDGGIAGENSIYTPLKFVGIDKQLTKELLNVFLEEIYKLQDSGYSGDEVVILYAHKEIEVTQKYINQSVKNTGKTELAITLKSLDELLAEKKDALFTPDNATLEIKKQNKQYQVTIKKFFSNYLFKKIEDYNDKKVKKGTLEEDLNKKVTISNSGLELIESVQFDTTLDKVWISNPDLEDKAGIKEKIKGVYTLQTNKFKLKIRNIAGDELIIDSKDLI